MASEGASVEQARANPIGALTLFLAAAGPSEAARGFHDEVFVTQVEVAAVRRRGGLCVYWDSRAEIALATAANSAPR